MKEKLLLPLFILAAALTARADSPAPLPPAQQYAFLTPYLNDSTFMVTHIDTALVDTAALQKFLTDAITAAAPNQHDALQNITDAKTLADTFLARFHQLGGRHIYLISYCSTVPGDDSEPQPPIVLLPLEVPTSDPQPFINLVTTIPDFPPAVAINNSLFAIDLDGDTSATAPADALAQKIKAIVPSARPDVEKALAASTGAAQLVMAPGDATRKTISADAATLPPELGGGSSDIFTKNFQYLLVSLTPPPNARFTLIAQSDSPDNAKLTLNVITIAFKSMAETDSTHLDMNAIFAPAIDKSAVVADLDEPKIQKALSTLIPAFFTARQQAMQIKSSANLRQVLNGGLMYALQNNDAWPANLHALIDQKLLADEKNLTNPGDPKKRPYEYHYWSPDELKKLDASSTPVLWEATDDDSAPLNVGYLDGHVDLLKSKSELTQQLDAAKAKLKTP